MVVCTGHSPSQSVQDPQKPHQCICLKAVASQTSPGEHCLSRAGMGSLLTGSMAGETVVSDASGCWGWVEVVDEWFQ